MKQIIFIYSLLFVFSYITIAQGETRLFSDEDLEKYRYESNEQEIDKENRNKEHQELEPLGTDSEQVNDLTFEDLEYIELMQKQGMLPEDMKLGTITHEYIAKLKQVFKEIYGFDFEILKNPLKPDPRFSSPEKTWEIHRRALLAGDLDRALECFIPQSVEQYRKTYKAFGTRVMREIAEDMGSIEKIEGDNTYARYEILRNEEGKIYSYDLLFNNWFGEWKIVRY